MAGNLADIFGGEVRQEDFPTFERQEEFLPPVEEQIRQMMRDQGMNPPSAIIIDGEVHRFPLKASAGDDTGWYRFYPDHEMVCGYVGDWRDGGAGFTFRQNLGRPFTMAEEMKFKKRAEQAAKIRTAERKAALEEAAKNAEAMWNNSTPVTTDHFYITKKKLKSAHGARINGAGELIFPLHDEDGKIWTLERILQSGDKRSFPGGQKKNHFWIIGDTEADSVVYITEGFATGATVQEETGSAVAIAFGASNILSTAKSIRKIHPDKQIIIAADNDGHGTGQKAAYEAAEATGARVVVSPMSELGNDFNDFYCSGGDVGGLLKPKNDSWLVPASELLSQPRPIKWHIKGWLQEQCFIMIHGPSGGGKTFTVLDMVLHMATGQPEWFGHKVKQAPVVYLAGEGHHGISARIKGWLQNKNIEEISDFWVSSSGTDLNTPEGLNYVIDHINALPVKPGVIVIDTLHRFLLGNEDSAVDAKTMIDSCAKLKQIYGCSTVLVHHTGLSSEAQERGRGSSSWRGATDNEINVLPKGDKVRIAPMKMKDSEKKDPFFVKLDVITIDGWQDEDGEAVTTCVLTETEGPKEMKSAKEIEDINLLRDAWIFSGAESDTGLPTITEAAFKEFYRQEGKTEDIIKKHFNINGKRTTPIKRLVDGAILCKEKNYFKVISPELVAQMMIGDKGDI